MTDNENNFDRKLSTAFGEGINDALLAIGHVLSRDPKLKEELELVVSIRLMAAFRRFPEGEPNREMLLAAFEAPLKWLVSFPFQEEQDLPKH
jgi:hypothetical protein